MTAPAPRQARLAVDVWSDVMCPFCYIGDTLLGQAIERFPRGEEVEVRYHSFQIMPDLPVDQGIGLDELLERERGIPRDQAAAMNAAVAERAAEVGLGLRLEAAIATNTKAAHRLLHFAASGGRQHEMARRLFRAYFTDGLDIGNYDVLEGLAAEVGLDRIAARRALDSGAFEAEFEADVRQAGGIGIAGVPFFVFGGRYAVTGAQPIEALLGALERAWTETVDAAAA